MTNNLITSVKETFKEKVLRKKKEKDIDWNINLIYTYNSLDGNSSLDSKNKLLQTITNYLVKNSKLKVLKQDSKGILSDDWKEFKKDIKCKMFNKPNNLGFNIFIHRNNKYYHVASHDDKLGTYNKLLDGFFSTNEKEINEQLEKIKSKCVNIVSYN